MKTLIHAKKLSKLANTHTLQQAAEAIGMTYNQVMYIAGKHKISFRKKGSSHYKSTLEESDIPLIRQLAIDNIPKRLIAKKFEVNIPVIDKILSGDNWAHVK